MKNVGIKIKSDNFNDLFRKSVESIILKGKWTNPRGFNCKELLSPQLILTNPNKCLITIKDRKLNYAYLIIEKMMILSAFQDPEILIVYNKKMSDYVNKKTGKFDGSYGDRIANDGNNQLKWCYNELLQDNDSRRAVVTIHDVSDNNHDTKDSACTLNLHFIIRDGALDLITNMRRSNDVLWGLCLDVPVFVFMQEIIASWLGIPMGKYIHNTSSLHYYDTVEKLMLKSINSESELLEKENPKWDIPFNLYDDALRKFWREEYNIRRRGEFEITSYDVINKYLKELKNYWDNKNKV